MRTEHLRRLAAIVFVGCLVVLGWASLRSRHQGTPGRSVVSAPPSGSQTEEVEERSVRPSEGVEPRLKVRRDARATLGGRVDAGDGGNPSPVVAIDRKDGEKGDGEWVKTIDRAAAEPHRPDQLLVRFRAASDLESRRHALQALGALDAQPLADPALVAGLDDWFVVSLPKGSNLAAAMRGGASEPALSVVEPNHTRRLFGDPNDPEYPLQWGLHNPGYNPSHPALWWMDWSDPDSYYRWKITTRVYSLGADIAAPSAWEITTGSKSVMVAVLDSGVDYRHPDLAANIYVNPADGTHGCNLISGNKDPMDDNGHGTQVAGIIGAVGDNGIGVSGVCWSVTLLPVKVFNAGGASSDDVLVQGIQYAIRQGAHVINASWGGPGRSQALEDAISAAQAAGVLFVCAAGNDGVNLDENPVYPACYEEENILTVGMYNTDGRTFYQDCGTNSTDLMSDVVARYTNYGPKTVRVFAPGVDIPSTIPNEGYDYGTGTSFAAPHVAGIAALLKAARPTIAYAEMKEAILANGCSARRALDHLLGANTHAIRGRVTCGGQAMRDVTVTLSGPKALTATTGTGGEFFFAGLADGSYTLTASRTGYTMSPASPTITLAGADATGQDIAATPVGLFTVSGSVLDGGLGVAGATVSLVGEWRKDSVVTGTDGAFSFTSARPGAYSLLCAPARGTVNPSYQAIEVRTSDVRDVRFDVSLPSRGTVQVFRQDESPGMPIPDVGTATSYLTVHAKGNLADYQQVTVSFDISHTYVGDLEVSVWAPLTRNANGSFTRQGVTLVSHEGGPGTHLTRSVVLRAYDLGNAQMEGIWTLTVNDTMDEDVGVLNEWRLDATPSGGGVPTSAFPMDRTSTQVKGRGSATKTLSVATAGLLCDVGIAIDMGVKGARLTVTAPDGTQVVLHDPSEPELGGNHSFLTTGDDHYFVSYEPLSRLLDRQSAGTWTLRVEVTDDKGYAYINGWGIPLQTKSPPLPAITSPAPGATLTSSSATFTLDSGADVTDYRLSVGSAQGGTDCFSKDLGTSLTAAVTGLPTDGRTLYARLTWQTSAGSAFADYSYTAAGSVPPSIYAPAPGSTLTSTSTTLCWSAGKGVTSYRLCVGTTAGGGDVHDSGELGLTLSESVSGLPTNGKTLYVRLWYQQAGAWQHVDATYATQNLGGGAVYPVFINPWPFSKLTSSTVNFIWSFASGASSYRLCVGRTAGGSDLFDSGPLGYVQTQMVSGLPTDGSKVYARVWYLVGGNWTFVDSSFTAMGGSGGGGSGGGMTAPAFKTPAPGSKLTSSTVTFTWSAGTSVTMYWLDVGRTKDVSDILSSGDLGTALTKTVRRLPTDGSTIYVSLFYLQGGDLKEVDATYTAAGR